MGSSGGILCVWDKGSFRNTRELVSRNYVAVEGYWLSSNTPILIISVYAPQELGEKRELWNRLGDVIRKWNGEVILMGDFNEV